MRRLVQHNAATENLHTLWIWLRKR